ncbi:MAG: amidohydrolase family protein, partial [Chthoniobacterales bacterium]
FAFGRLRALGFNIALGTDSRASTADLSLFAEMRQFSSREPAFAPERLLEMVTVNAAAALGQADALGRIRPGFKADLIAVPFTGAIDDVLEELLGFTANVPWTMVNGRKLALD